MESGPREGTVLIFALLKRAIVPLALLLLALAFASPASATPTAPRLLGTHPSSPGISTTPRIYGTTSEVVTTVLGPRSFGSGAISEGIGGETTIGIFAQPDCSGPELASGSSGEFENSGIPVSVAPNSTTTFYANSTDATGTSECSGGATYVQVSEPPSMPTVAAVSPAGPVDDNFPRVIGSADAGSTVQVFDNASCAGAPLGTGTAAQFGGEGIQVSVADNTTTTFYARATWAELPSACSTSSASFEEVSAGESPTEPSPPAAPPPPSGSAGDAVGPAKPVAPKIHTQPGHRSNDLTPLVAGSAPGAASVAIYGNSSCAGSPVASGSASDLTAGIPVSVAENGSTAFSARATDAAGQVSSCSEEALYVEDSEPPLTRITFGPGVKTRKRAPVFRFADVTDDPPGTNFSCRLNKQRWQPCQSPWRASHLRPGRPYTLAVRATDVAGNVEAAAVKRRFKVIRQPR